MTLPSRRPALLAALAIVLPLALAACESFEAAEQERASATRADPAAEQQQLVERAAATIEDARTDPLFGNAPDLLQRARALVVVPELVRGGLIVGGEGGNAVLLARNASGWSDPAFYFLGSGSIGLQIGVESAEVVMFVMSEEAFQALLAQPFKFGAQAGFAIANVGSSAQAGTGTDLEADIIVWSRAQGAYAGLTLEGSVLEPREEYNQAYYGQAITPQEIVGSSGKGRSDTLRTALASR